MKKKQVTRQMKRSLSLLLTILMLMTTWVWVAPTKAEAATYGSDYSVTFTGESYKGGGNAAMKDGWVTIFYYPYNSDGTLNTNINKQDYKKDIYNKSGVDGTPAMNGSNYSTYNRTVTVPGWPYELEASIKSGNVINKAYLRVDSLSINGVQVLTGPFTFGSMYGDAETKNWGFEGSGVGDWGSDTAHKNWTKPKLTSISASPSNLNFTIPSYNSNTSWTDYQTVTFTGKDQYGANFPITATHSLSLNGAAYSNSAIQYSSTGISTSIRMSQDAQKINPGAKSAVVMLETTVNGKDIGGGAASQTWSTSLSIGKPEYKITYDLNSTGSVWGDGEPTTSGSDGLVYGAKITTYPKTAMRDGYDFLGLTKGATADTYTLNRPTNITYLNGTQTVDTSGSCTWYAHWGAKTITATFRNADGQLIGTLDGRYNRPMVHQDIYSSVDTLNRELNARYPDAVKWNGTDPVYETGGSTYTFHHWKLVKAYDMNGNDITDSLTDPDIKTTLLGNAEFEAVYELSTGKKYTVTFYDENGGVVSSKDDCNYREHVEFPTAPSKAADLEYNYTFKGWAEKAGENGANSYIVNAEGLTDEGAAIYYIDPETVEDLTVRKNVSYVPVYEKAYNTYTVSFKHRNDGGADYNVVSVEGLKYKDVIEMPDGLKDNYTAGGYRYPITGYTANGVTFAEGITLESFASVLSANPNAEIVFEATYGTGKPAVYTINFYDIDGKLINSAEGANQFEHGNPVAVPTTPDDIPQIVDRYNEVKDEDGNVIDKIYTERYEFTGWAPEVATNAGADAEYYAQYTSTAYASVTYVDAYGSELKVFNGKVEEDTNKLFVGDAIPRYMITVEDEEGNSPTVLAEPQKAEDVRATYKFEGWSTSPDGEIIDLETATITSSNMVLYPVYEETLKEYTVTFKPENGGEDITATYNYGADITLPTDPVKASDDTYNYAFRGWSPEVSEKCFGDATYTATYRKEYRYYQVTWFNDAKAVYSATNYIFNERINMPGTPAATDITGTPDSGYTWVIKEWVACDANGNVLTGEDADIFERGDRMPAKHLYFYPTYEQKPNQMTVKFYDEDGALLSTEAVPYDTSVSELNNYAPETRKNPDDDNHYTFEKWVDKASGADITGNITTNLDVKAKYKAEEHNFVPDMDTVITYPTCTDTGLVNMKCTGSSCNKTVSNITVAPIPDTVKPEGYVYIGSSRWSSTDAPALENKDGMVYVGPKSNAIINAIDYNIASEPWNIDGTKTSRVGKIEVYVSEAVVTDFDTIAAAEWIEAYNYDSAKAEILERVLLEHSMTRTEYALLDALKPDDEAKKAEIDSAVESIMANYPANATNTLENLEELGKLVDGKEYVLYVRLTDRAMALDTENGGLKSAHNENYFSSGWFCYDNDAPTITITGNGVGTRYCTDATITVSDDSTETADLKVVLNGVEKTLEEGKLLVTNKGINTISVTDKNGNVTSNTFEIKGAHSYRHYVIASTCEAEGWRYDQCAVCEKVNNAKAIPVLGHEYNGRPIVTNSTCTTDGKWTYICSNGCGRTQEATPDNVETATFREFTAEEIAAVKALKAAGHTYAKATDEAGQPTTEDLWIIDKNPTCSADGSRYKVCLKCKTKVTEIIPADPEAHKLYRPFVAQEPTCTEPGWKNAVCKYCGQTIEKVENIPETGHVEAEEWTIVTAAKCKTALDENGEVVDVENATGLRVKYCAKGCKDENGDLIVIKREEIPALEHVLVKGETVAPTGTSKGYTIYKCVNAGCNYYEKKLYTELIPEFEIKFWNIGAEAPEKAIKKYKDESISALDAPTVTKDADNTNKYVFDYWATRTGAGTEESPYVYTKVELPITVSANVDLYAVFKPVAINYTITYLNADGSDYKKVGYLGYEESVNLATGPAKSSDTTYTYTFSGWSDGNKVYKITEPYTVKGNVTLTAVFEKKLREYTVTFMNAGSVIEIVKVNAGEAATCSETPEKAYDSKNHYSFKEWDNPSLNAVYANIVTNPIFEPAKHSYESTINQAADCLNAEKLEYKCSSCDHSYEAKGKDALGHLWGEPYLNENGESVRKCQRDGCEAVENDTTTYTVSFYLNADDKDNGVRACSVTGYKKYNSKLDSMNVPAAPRKADDDSYTYTFEGWALLEAPTTVVDPLAIVIQADIDYVAVFTATKRVYNVVYAYDAEHVIKTFRNIEAGQSVSYTGETPSKAFDTEAHYKFVGWKLEGKATIEGSTVSGIQSDIYLTAQFDRIEHEYDESRTQITDATCLKGTGTTEYCKGCDFSYTIESGRPLGHDLREKSRKDATPEEKGWVVYECTRCDYEEKQDLIWTDPSAEYVLITVTVKDSNGSLVEGATVELFQNGNWVAKQISNARGIAQFLVLPGKYTIVVSGIANADAAQSEITVGEDGSVTGAIPVPYVRHCSCACHRNNIWGTIFRFFHKLIKMLTGEFKCCADPDPMYGI